jgi:hypothetical protein
MTIDRLSPRWQERFADSVRFGIAPVVLFSSGFFTADFFMSGVYTWPRTSRVVVLTLTVCVLAYEFVYKEHRDRHVGRDPASLKPVLYSCALPYAMGILALVALARLAT